MLITCNNILIPIYIYIHRHALTLSKYNNAYPYKFTDGERLINTDMVFSCVSSINSGSPQWMVYNGTSQLDDA